MQEVGAKEPLLRPSTPLNSSATVQVGEDCINSIQVYLMWFNLNICCNMHQHQLRINTPSWCRINAMKSLSSSLNHNYRGWCVAWGWFQFHRILIFSNNTWGATWIDHHQHLLWIKTKINELFMIAYRRKYFFTARSHALAGITGSFPN